MLGLLIAPMLLQAPASVAVPQLTPPRTVGVAGVGELTATPRGELAAVPAQVGEGQHSVAAAPALSSSAQSRVVGTAPVGGRDRCDPTSATADSALCRNRVETRAGEFSAPTAAPVTAEGRLLLLTRPQPEAPMTPAGVGRRLGGSAEDVERAAGTAAGELAAAISQTQNQSNAQLTPNGGAPTNTPTAGVLPPGVPTVVVTTPR